MPAKDVGRLGEEHLLAVHTKKISELAVSAGMVMANSALIPMSAVLFKWRLVFAAAAQCVSATGLPQCDNRVFRLAEPGGSLRALPSGLIGRARSHVRIPLVVVRGRAA